MKSKFDVLGIGNAIMDILGPVPHDFLSRHGMTKGAMDLIDTDRCDQLDRDIRAQSGDAIQEIAGGSVANSIAGIADMGLCTAYMGKVANDPVGQRFAEGLNALGVTYETQPLNGVGATSRCLIAVTPDGERTMNTYLGASQHFGKTDISKTLIQAAKVTYLEGYLYDLDRAKAAFIKAAEIAKTANRKIALTLSDSFCVDRHRADFLKFIKNHVDILFANETELLSLFETDDMDVAIKAITPLCPVTCVTRSEKGSIILESGQRHTIAPVYVSEIVDTTGAGDQYAAGVLAGHAMGLPWDDAGRLGSVCAAEVISHYGARPEKHIYELIAG